MENRIEQLVAALPANFEAALVKTAPNRFYFLDFDSDDAGTLLILRDGAVFFIDSRYTEIARRQVTAAEVAEETNALGQVRALLAEHGVKSLYLEDEITMEYYAQLKGALPGVQLICDVTLSGAICTARSIKDAEEVSRIRTAQAITDDCFTYICGQLRPGIRQIDAALMMETYMRKNGSQGLAFPTIFISGPDTSMPHGVPGERVIENGDFITMDFGARYKGYCADMTRTVALGSVTEQMEQVYALVLKAQLAACAGARAGMVCSEIDAIARDIIRDGGYGGQFGHGLGHSLGIEIHEDPRFSPKCGAVAKAGQMMTIEPGIYLPGKFGVRIEDTVLMTETGCEILGNSTKNLIIL